MEIQLDFSAWKVNHFWLVNHIYKKEHEKCISNKKRKEFSKAQENQSTLNWRAFKEYIDRDRRGVGMKNIFDHRGELKISMLKMQ